MINRLLSTTLLIIFAIRSLSAGEVSDVFSGDELDQLSYYMGYMIGRDHVKNSYGFPTRFDKIVEGMQAGISGEPVLGKDELIPLIKRMQKTVVEKQAALNLQESECYLTHLKEIQPDLIEVESSKLFYRILKEGNGSAIGDLPWLHFKMYELQGTELTLSYSTSNNYGEALQVDLDAVVPGFSRGIQGMKIGETRTIYVHPDLAFGMGKLGIAPNRLIVFEITAVQGK